MYLELRFGVFVFAQGPLGMREPLLCNHGKKLKMNSGLSPLSDNVKYNSEKTIKKNDNKRTPGQLKS